MGLHLINLGWTEGLLWQIWLRKQRIFEFWWLETICDWSPSRDNQIWAWLCLLELVQSWSQHWPKDRVPRIRNFLLLLRLLSFWNTRVKSPSRNSTGNRQQASPHWARKNCSLCSAMPSRSWNQCPNPEELSLTSTLVSTRMGPSNMVAISNGSIKLWPKDSKASDDLCSKMFMKLKIRY